MKSDIGSGIKPFRLKVLEEAAPLKADVVSIVQVNVGKLCNQTCSHCHVDAGPKRTEIMDKETFDRLLHLISRSQDVTTVDITGGAPELNPHFRYFVESLRKESDKIEIIDRCNLTVLFEGGQEDLAEFLRANRVHIIASLPCYLEDNVDKQRGKGVFEKSIRALNVLNDLGYGGDHTDLKLDLVYNPQGASLPPNQAKLQESYKSKLFSVYGIKFNSLLTITNMPIARFLRYLHSKGEYERYMALLYENFNRDALENVMCRTLVSVDWQGKLYDCDFNQMLDENGYALDRETIWDINSFEELNGRTIKIGEHCYGCTAGCGSSCSGAIVDG
ncbi:MAG: radical SAM/Cys-rich domain protein [Candidatus Dadabacteria bacterium]|nr:MAG: radical SAM/Cys-rich domain protein [Candidatus Dadabacteria bacterium]